jgi:hypothetical protein
VATIIVMSNESTDQDSVLTLSEHVQPEHLASKHHAAQLDRARGMGGRGREEGRANRTGLIALAP